MATNWLSAALRENVLLADGAIGTQLRRLRPAAGDACLEALNLSHPDLTLAVHRAYLDAGADILTTNTFGASLPRLRSLGREAEFAGVNRAGVELARQAANGAARVAASVGPLGRLRYPDDLLRPEQMRTTYAAQIEILAAAEPDLLFIETMDDFREAVAATEAALETGLPVVTHLVADPDRVLSGRIDLYTAIERLEAMGVTAVGLNCRIGPDEMLRLARWVARFASVPLSVQPNAGNLRVDLYGRMEVLDQPGMFERLAREAPTLGIGIVGGCCHTTPEHIRALRAALDGGRGTGDGGRGTGRRQPGERPASAFQEKLARGQFVACVEIDPPTDEEVTADPGVLAQKIDGARYLEDRCGVDVITVADHTMGRPWLDVLPFAQALHPHLRAADLLLHYSCRNKAETDITGNFASFKLYGYRNILIITGDQPPSDKCFYEYSSATLIQRIRREHGDYFFIAASFDHTRGANRPGSGGLDAEVKRLQRKIAAGAQVALTQPIYDVARVRILREKTGGLGIPVLPGIMPILSPRHAETVNRYPGIHVPESVIARLREAGEDRAERRRISVEISAEIARAIQAEGFAGVYLITPINRYDVVRRVLASLK